MLVCLVHGYILFLKLRHMCVELVKIDPCEALRYDRPYDIIAMRKWNVWFAVLLFIPLLGTEANE